MLDHGHSLQASQRISETTRQRTNNRHEKMKTQGLLGEVEPGIFAFASTPDAS